VKSAVTGGRNTRVSEAVIALASAVRGRVSDDGDSDSVDNTGSAIIDLLQRAADTSKENCQRAMDATQRLALQLRAAEDRVRDLEADVGHYKDHAARAEEWLLFILRQVEQQFFDPTSRGSFDRNE
jgi:hypothetical protein